MRERLNKPDPILTAILLNAGILFFAFMPRHTVIGYSASIAGLLLAAVIIALQIRKPGDLLNEFGIFAISSRRRMVLFLAGLLTGVIFAILYRKQMGQIMFGGRFTLIGLAAAAVGCTEELIFRGFLQQQLRKINVFMAVVVASASHSAYKIVFFAALSHVHPVNLKFLLVWTFIVGLIFGILKELSASTLTPVAGHASFDLLVYSDSSINPWWLWA